MSVLNTYNTMGMGIAPPEEWQKYLVSQQTLHQPEQIQFMQQHTLTPAIDPRIKAICDAAEKEIEAKRAQLIEAAKKAPPPPSPPLTAELRETVFSAVRKNNPQQAMLIADAGKATHCEICSGFSTSGYCDPCNEKWLTDHDIHGRGLQLQDANDRFNRRERRELHPGAAFRWTYRMS